MGKPIINRKHKICIVCEGDEEEQYIISLRNLALWPDYDVKTANAHGAGSISAKFQDKVSSDSYEAVLIFCDTDKYPFDQYAIVKQKLMNILGKNAKLDKFIIFANPCSMQIVLLHFCEDVILHTQSKTENASVIALHTGVANYKAHFKQILAICQQIHRPNYALMKDRIEKLSKDETITPSTNIGRFLAFLEAPDTDWIREIKKQYD